MVLVTGPAYTKIIDALVAHGCPVTGGTDRARSRCPAHNGRKNTSLSIRDGDNRVSLTCHSRGGRGTDSGCDRAHRGQQVSPAQDQVRLRGQRQGGQKVTRDAATKDFSQSCIIGPPTLFRHDQLATAATVWLVEGEEDVLALESLGVAATTAPQGAGNFAKVDATPLHGKKVIAVVDNDEAGQRWATDVRQALEGHADLRFVRAKTGKDAADHIGAGRSMGEFVPVVPSMPVVPSVPEVPHEAGCDLLDAVRDWFARFVCVVHEADLDLLALWTVHTHLVEETYTTPRLQLDSPIPESGKTTTLEHMQRLCVKPVQMATISSPALLTRMLVTGIRTLLFDEADRSLRPDKEGVADLLAVINSGTSAGPPGPSWCQVRAGAGRWWRCRPSPRWPSPGTCRTCPTTPARGSSGCCCCPTCTAGPRSRTGS